MKEQLLSGLSAGKDYRQAFVDESIRMRITAQIKALRDKEGWDYKQFAERIDRKVSWVYRLEDPNAAPPTIPTLLQVAAAFDIGLDVRFCSFSAFVDDVSALSPNSFVVPSFEEERRMGSFRQGKRHKIRVRGNHRRRKPKTAPRSESPCYKGDAGEANIGAASMPSGALAA